MDAHSATAPGKLRADESHELKTVKDGAAKDGGHAMASMTGTRVATGQQVSTGKTGAKGKDEEKRTQVTAILQSVFDKTKADVEGILSGLDTKVDEQFTAGEKRARDVFTAEHERGMSEYKWNRYFRHWNGPFLWAKDQFLPLPDEANRIYETAKDHYLSAMRKVISDIADTVERELRRAKDRIADGRTQLQDAVHKLPADLKAIGQEAAAEFDDKFDELKETVNAKGTELVETLATRYTDAVKSVDDEIAKEREKNKGLLAKAVDAVKGVINTIIELKNMLLGVLRKAAQAIGAILKDPIGFLGKLVSAVGGGLKLFLKNVGTHLQQGVLSWLLGTSAEAGLQLPTKFDIRGILLLIAALLGLTWANIRSRITRKVPDQAVTAAETAVPLIAQTKRQGVAGMWDELKSRVGDLKKDLIGRLVSYLMPTIIIAGITWILSLLNPASAFIRACKMIIDIVRFILTQGRQILEFVNSVLDAIIAIAKGGEGGVPALVERALARSIPVLIGALAALLGIGGIAGKVKQIFQAMARPVNRAVDWVVDKIVGLVKKLWSKLKAALDKRKRRPKARPGRPKDHDRPGKPRRPGKPGKPGKHRKARPDTKPPARTDSKKQHDLHRALEEAGHLAGKSGDEDEVRRGLPAIKARHQLSELTVSVRASAQADLLFRFEGAINPRATFEQLAVDKPLNDARKAYGHDPFAITDMPGTAPGIVVPGLTTTLRLGATQARKYAAHWIDLGKLNKETTSRGRVIYNFFTFTAPADLVVPRDHREYRKWMDGATAASVSVADADRYWHLILEGIRDRKPDNFEIVARDMMRGMRIPPGQGALWSGGVDLSDYAVSRGYTALEAQDFLAVAQHVNLLQDFPAVTPVWIAFSRRYAGQLRDEIHIFIRKLSPGSVLVTVELKTVAEVERRLRTTIRQRFHAMEWGDDPRHILDNPVPGYWRELRADGQPLKAGGVLEQDRAPAAAAAAEAERRFRARQAAKARTSKGPI
jgi:hypothetical protein